MKMRNKGLEATAACHNESSGSRDARTCPSTPERSIALEIVFVCVPEEIEDTARVARQPDPVQQTAAITAHARQDEIMHRRADSPSLVPFACTEKSQSGALLSSPAPLAPSSTFTPVHCPRRCSDACLNCSLSPSQVRAIFRKKH